jgi:hypothetical protein
MRLKTVLVKQFVIYTVHLFMVIQSNVGGDVMNQRILEIINLIMEVV